MGKEEEEDFVPMHAKEEGRPIGIHRSNQETQTAFVFFLTQKSFCVSCSLMRLLLYKAKEKRISVLQ